MESLRDSTRSTSISVASVFMRHVYQWMTVGLLVTAGTAFFVASSPALLSAIFGNTFGLIILAIAVFAMPLVLSGMISRLSAFAATALFVVYSALMGAFLSSVLLVYTGASVMSTFVTCAAMFGGMSIYGTVTKRDLTGMGSFMMMGLFGLIIAMIVNIFLQSSAMTFVISALLRHPKDPRLRRKRPARRRHSHPPRRSARRADPLPRLHQPVPDAAPPHGRPPLTGSTLGSRPLTPAGAAPAGNGSLS